MIEARSPSVRSVQPPDSVEQKGDTAEVPFVLSETAALVRRRISDQTVAKAESCHAGKRICLCSHDRVMAAFFIAKSEEERK